MKFPITRQTLQAFDIEKDRLEVCKEEIQRQLIQILETVCQDFKRNLYSPPIFPQNKYIWRKIDIIQSARGAGFMPDPDENLSTFIEMLKKTFIACDISMDPLKTYIIIDWS